MYYVAVPFLLLVALVEASIAPSFPVFGAHPDLMLVLLASWAVVRGPEEAMVLAPVGGAWLDLLGPAPFGVTILALAPLVLLALINELGLISSELLIALIVAAVGTILYYTVQVAVLDVVGYADASLAGLRAALFPGTLVNAALVPVLYFPLRAVTRGSRSARHELPRL